jgi:hypothetical protein
LLIQPAMVAIFGELRAQQCQRSQCSAAPRLNQRLTAQWM